MKTGSSKPFISICIPAYKNPGFLKRLLDSILEQQYKNFEVIITDDSPDDSVRQLVHSYDEKIELRYHKNPKALGTPGNWNAAIERANGQWIKLIHDDDWLATPGSLQRFVDAIETNPGAGFIFAAFNNVRLSNTASLPGDEPVTIRPEKFRLIQLRKDPVTLLSKNIIGPPSVVIYRKDAGINFDIQLKWLVDMDFYIRYLEVYKAVYLDDVLVNIGLNAQQVTNSSSLVSEVEIPEHFAVLNKTGIRHLRNILVYDAWWRLFRNLAIRNTQQIKASGYPGNIPGCIRNMIAFQSRLPLKLLKIGPFSKSMMTMSYLQNKMTGKLS